MIGSVRGRIASKTPPQLTVDVGGLGYELEAPMSTFFHLPAVGEEVRLLTHLVVREDAHVLYAFATEDERRLFRSLIKVSGVGPKIALALLSGISVAGFAECVQREDISALTRVPGVGRKTAERLIVEMRDRLAAPQVSTAATTAAAGASPETEAFGALVALGYRAAEATRLLKAVGPGTHSTEELIRRALQGAARESSP
jgi:holliday junction DNA helicase RuvA